MLQRRHCPEVFRETRNDYQGGAYQRFAEMASLERGANLGGPAVLLYRLEHVKTREGPFGTRAAASLLREGGAFNGPSPNMGPSGGINAEAEICATADWESWCSWFGKCDLAGLRGLGFVVAAYLCEAKACTRPDRWGQVVFNKDWAVRVEIYDVVAFGEGEIVLAPEPAPEPELAPDPATYRASDLAEFVRQLQSQTVRWNGPTPKWLDPSW